MHHHASVSEEPASFSAVATAADQPASAADTDSTSVAEAVEYYQLTQALKAASGNVQQAAQLLDMPSSSLYRRLRKLNIRAKEYRKL
jgi:transcriptional regulator of acetoin/glycerol metabolism